MESQAVGALPGGDEMLIWAWLHGRPANTVTAYRNDASRFLAHAGKPLAEIELADLQAWDTSLVGDRATSRVRRLSAAKSLLTFAHGLGAIATDPGRALRLAKPTATTAERILAEADVQRMIGAEQNPNRKALLRLLYLCGLRASEAAALCWRDMTPVGKAGEAKILGKGAKLRTVGVPAGAVARSGCADTARQPRRSGGAVASRPGVRSAGGAPGRPRRCEARGHQGGGVAALAAA